MQINFEPGDARYLITGYDSGSVKVNGETYEYNLVVTPEKLLPELLPADIGELAERHIRAVCETNAEVVLLGTGDAQVFPEARLLAVAGDYGLQIDVMTTAAACRTYAVLISEGRRVTAALFV